MITDLNFSLQDVCVTSLHWRAVSGTHTILPQVRTVEEQLTSAIVMLRSTLNAAVPFHQLPLELVKAVFAFVPTLQYTLASQKKQMPIVDVWQRRHIAKMSELYTLMLVCRQWRDIVAGMPSFWNTIDQAYTRAQTTFLERSGYGPLRIILRNTPSAFMSTLCDTESARIVEIHHSGVAAATAEEYLGFPAPALRVLHLTNSWFFGRRTLTETGHTVQLFRGQTPHLRQLSLHHIHWFPVVQTAALTHLDVDMCRWDDHLVKIMGMLASAPNLTDLVLSSLSSIRPDVDSLDERYPDGSVSLALLRRLRLRYAHSEEAVTAVLAKLVFPPTTALDIAKAMDARHFSEDILPTLARLPVMQTVYRVSIALASVPLQDPQGPSTTIAQLTAASAQSALACTPLALPSGPAALTAVLPAAQIRELWLTVISHHVDDEVMNMINPLNPVVQGPPILDVEPDALREFLQPMAGALETLVVWGHVLPTVVEALVIHDVTATRPLCPKLTTLRLMLSNHSPPVHELMPLLAAQQDVLRLKDVQVNYLRAHAGPRPEHLPLDHSFVSIKYVSRSEVPRMGLPSVCAEEAHARWTPWIVDYDGMFIEEDGENRDHMVT